MTLTEESCSSSPASLPHLPVTVFVCHIHESIPSNPTSTSPPTSISMRLELCCFGQFQNLQSSSSFGWGFWFWFVFLGRSCVKCKSPTPAQFEGQALGLSFSCPTPKIANKSQHFLSHLERAEEIRERSELEGIHEDHWQEGWVRLEGRQEVGKEAPYSARNAGILAQKPPTAAEGTQLGITHVF